MDSYQKSSKIIDGINLIEMMIPIPPLSAVSFNLIDNIMAFITPVCAVAITKGALNFSSVTP